MIVILDYDAAKKKPARMFALGIQFWKDVELGFGGSIATAGQSMVGQKAIIMMK